LVHDATATQASREHIVGFVSGGDLLELENEVRWAFCMLRVRKQKVRGFVALVQFEFFLSEDDAGGWETFSVGFFA